MTPDSLPDDYLPPPVALNTSTDAERAAGLFGLADRLLRESGGTLEAADRREAERYQAAARTALGDEALVAAWRIGQTLSLEKQMRE